MCAIITEVNIAHNKNNLGDLLSARRTAQKLSLVPLIEN
jgi:hypothetical protein